MSKEYLLQAIKSGDFNGAKSIIGKMNREELTKGDEEGYTILHELVISEHERISKLLLINHHFQLYDRSLHDEDMIKMVKNEYFVHILTILFTKNSLTSRKDTLYSLFTNIDQIEALKVIFNQENYRGYIDLCAICKKIIEICPEIINFKTKEGDTALDLIMINSKINISYLRLYTEKITEILLAKGADSTFQLSSWLKTQPATERMEQIILSSLVKKYENLYPLQINEDLYEMLIERCCFKFINMLNNFKNEELYEIYQTFIYNIRVQFDEVLCKKMETALQQINVNGKKLPKYEEIEKFKLAEYEAQLISIFESSIEKMSSLHNEAITQALNYNFKNSNSIFTAKKFYENRPEYQTIGVYFNKILNNQPKLIEKLKIETEGLKILLEVQKKVILPFELAVKLNKFLNKLEFEKESSTENTQTISLGNVVIEKLHITEENKIISETNLEELSTTGQIPTYWIDQF